MVAVICTSETASIQVPARRMYAVSPLATPSSMI